MTLFQVSVCTRVSPTCRDRNGTMDATTPAIVTMLSTENTDVLLSKLHKALHAPVNAQGMVFLYSRIRYLSIKAVFVESF
jgi:hypothetical protein